ncbi:OsmC family protein [Saprospiraceae bacterium]|jgi:putative redox protein|nr:OsmC family protein [Bacteroidota bacterium]MDB4728357.1 OsmC family protein [Saprospiraceae bacterium]MDF1868207.1 OsmC family protein [Saprospiraceae bacterium]
MKVTLKRLDDAFHMQATNESGNTLETDGNPEIGGGNKAFRPMQMMLAGIGGCSSIDVIYLLKKQRQPLEDIDVKITAEREEGKVPSLFTKIHLHFDLKGDLDKKKVERACALSMEKYCSVAKLLEKTAKIEWSYSINS